MDRKKPHSQVFVIFPETDDTGIRHPFIKNEYVRSSENLDEYLKILGSAKKLIEAENYCGFFDSQNIIKFLRHYEILGQEYYPISPSRRLGLILRDWFDWRAERQSPPIFSCELFNTSLNDDTFCEIACRKTNFLSNKHVLTHNDSLTFATNICSISVGLNNFEFDCLNLICLRDWFCNNRVPARVYNPNRKHGENGHGEWKNAAKLLCSHADATRMLHKAIGISGENTLFCFDRERKKYIVFRYGGKIPKNEYHAYHVENEIDVPQKIKEILNLV